MTALTIDQLIEAARPGGSSALTSRTHLAPAAGEEALIAPAKYLSGRSGTYVYETRFLDGGPKRTVLVDSRTSAANRLEDALIQAIDAGHPILTRLPRIRVSYAQATPPLEFTDLELPHRAFDAHIRLGTHAGQPVTAATRYVEARNSTPSNAWNLLNLSPDTVLFGGWDSTRRSHQARFASNVVGEIIGVLADQSEERPTRRSGARIDPMAPAFDITPAQAKELAGLLGDDVSAKVKKGKKASDFLLGAIPPGTQNLDGIATSDILRTHVISFSTLRTLRFGRGADGDAAVRALLAAIAIAAIARADSELVLRANAFLVEKEPPRIELDARFGGTIEIDPPTVEQTDDLLSSAFELAEKAAGIDWHGQLFEVQGNAALPKAADATASE